MAENTMDSNISDEVPAANNKNPLKQSNIPGHTTISNGPAAGFNAGGALQQLSELLSLHAKGGAINEFKGTYCTVI